MNKKLFAKFMTGEVAVHVSTQEQCAKFSKPQDKAKVETE